MLVVASVQQDVDQRSLDACYPGRTTPRAWCSMLFGVNRRQRVRSLQLGDKPLVTTPPTPGFSTAACGCKAVFLGTMNGRLRNVIATSAYRLYGHREAGRELSCSKPTASNLLPGLQGDSNVASEPCSDFIRDQTKRLYASMHQHRFHSVLTVFSKSVCGGQLRVYHNP